MNFSKMIMLAAAFAFTVALGACASKEEPVTMDQTPATYGYSK